MKLYVGNLNFETTETELHDLFAKFGEVVSAQIIIDRETDRSRGFGFVELRHQQEAKQAISELDGTDFGGREIKVNEAKARARS